MLKRAGMVSLCAAASLAAAFAQEGDIPKGVPHLDHVFVIMMENHAYKQIIGNPDAPFINQYAESANLATNYFAVAHPSLTNYLEVVGGSNFGILNDNPPDWHNEECTPNLLTGQPALDNGSTPGPTYPISGVGTDAATPVLDTTNETTGPPGDIEIDGKRSIPANKQTVAMSIADQLTNWGLTWRSYQESLPPTGADNVNYADGFYTDKSNLSDLKLSSTDTLIDLYAVKHNPFVYFKSIQDSVDPDSSLANVRPFDGENGLWNNLRTGHVPNYSFIAPNQCNDMHGRSNAGAACADDPNDNGTLIGLNPGLVVLGDHAVENLVKAIHSSPVWKNGRTAIVVLWDENDYSVAPTTNQVPLIVDTNYGVHGVKSANFYDHFSLLRSVEAGLGLPCLNNACKADVISDLFASEK